MMQMNTEKKFLNIPVTEYGSKCTFSFYANGEIVYTFRVKLTCGVPDYWVAVDLRYFGDIDISLEISNYTGTENPYVVLQFTDIRIGADRLDKEDLRPRYHFSPISGWLNDPNGLMFYKGTYFLFCQLNPYYQWCDNMHWTLLKSNDLVHWTDEGLVLYPDKTGQKFSGSGVVDTENVSGLKEGEEDPLLLFYTAQNGFTQDLAYSTDGGNSWKIYEENPVVPHLKGMNRDPKVIRKADSSGWWMALYLDGNDYVLLESDDLLHWQLCCTLNVPGCLECPDIYEIYLDDDKNKPYMIFSCAGGEYLVGHMENGQFISVTEVQRCYEGNDVYAPQSFYGVEDGRRIQVICSSNNVMLPGEPFGKFLTLPCELKLRSISGGMKLFNRPVKELECLKENTPVFCGEISLESGKCFNMKHLENGLFSLIFDVDKAYAGTLELHIYNLDFNYNGAQHKITYKDRTVSFIPRGENIRFEIWVDRCSAELFVDDGQIYWPAVKPLDHDACPIGICASENTTLKNCKVSNLTSLLPWQRKSV